MVARASLDPMSKPARPASRDSLSPKTQTNTAVVDSSGARGHPSGVSAVVQASAAKGLPSIAATASKKSRIFAISTERGLARGSKATISRRRGLAAMSVQLGRATGKRTRSLSSSPCPLAY